MNNTKPVKRQLEDARLLKDASLTTITWHVASRHKTFLWALAFFVTNTAWIVSLAPSMRG